jgi:hypothetical protein
MKRFLEYSDPKICEILHLPRLSEATLVFFKKEKKKNPSRCPGLSTVSEFFRKVAKATLYIQGGVGA